MADWFDSLSVFAVLKLSSSWPHPTPTFFFNHVQKTKNDVPRSSFTKILGYQNIFGTLLLFLN